MKTNNPLTVDNIVYLFNQENYTSEQLMSTLQDDPNRFRLPDYNKVIKKLLDYFFIDYDTSKSYVAEPLLIGTTILVNEKIKYKWLENFSCIEFYALYPNIMSKLWKEGKANFNIYEFGVMYNFFVENSKKIKSDPKISETGKMLFRFILNYTYGASLNHFSRSFISFDSVDKVPIYTKEVFEHIMEQNPHNIFYLDCDEIYLDYVSPEVLSCIKSLGLPFTIENNINGMFMEKKKYIIQKGNIVRPRGLRSSFRSKYKLEKNRINKLQKILNKINNASY